MDNRRFTIVTALKILFYAAAVAGTKIACERFLAAPLDRLIPSLVAALLTLAMIYFGEHNKPSFFSMGNIGESIIVGFTSALLIYAIPIYIMWSTDNIRFCNTPDGNFMDGLCYSCDEGLLPAIVIFGYLFHMLWSYISDRVAVFVCSLLYFVYIIFCRYNIIAALLNDELVSSNAVTLVNLVLLAVSVSFMVLTFGDVLSAGSYLFSLCWLEYIAAFFLHIGMFGRAMTNGMEMYSLPTVMLMLILRLITFYIYNFAKSKKTT